MKLGVLYAGGEANCHYRAVVPLGALARRGHQVRWLKEPSRVPSLDQLSGCELVHAHRCLTAEHLELFLALRERGVAIVWDNDDDLSAAPKLTRKHDGLSRRELRRIYERTIEIARHADLMTTPSQHLAAKYRAAGVERVQVIENALHPDDTRRRRNRHRGLVIGCVAGREHRSDLAKLKIEGVLRTVLERHAGVRVVTYGEHLELRDPRYVPRDDVGIEQLIRNETEFDIGIAPLVDSPLNRARSDIKLKEYAAAGAMWLASPIGPYVGMGEEQGGLLVADREWLPTIGALVEDHERRLRLTENARNWAKRQTVEQTVGAWEAAFRGAIERARRRRGPRSQLTGMRG